MIRKCSLVICVLLAFLSADPANGEGTDHGAERIIRYPIIRSYVGVASYKDSLYRSAHADLTELAKKYGVNPNRFLKEDPIPLVVSDTEESSGRTSYSMKNGKIYCDEMRISGRNCAEAKSAFRHELTHYLLNHELGAWVPRWADEGLGIWEEGRLEAKTQWRQICGDRKLFPIRATMYAKEYPADRLRFYRTSFALVSFLLFEMKALAEKKGKTPEALLFEFIRWGSQSYFRPWDSAIKRYLAPARSIADLERPFSEFVGSTCGSHSF